MLTKSIWNCDGLEVKFLTSTNADVNGDFAILISVDVYDDSADVDISENYYCAIK